MSSVINGLSILHFVRLKQRRNRRSRFLRVGFSSTAFISSPTGVAWDGIGLCDFAKAWPSSKRTVFDNFTLGLGASVQLVWDVVRVGTDDCEEFVRIVDAGERTRRNSVPSTSSFCSAANEDQSELSQCSRPIFS